MRRGRWMSVVVMRMPSVRASMSMIRCSGYSAFSVASSLRGSSRSRSGSQRGCDHGSAGRLGTSLREPQGVGPSIATVRDGTRHDSGDNAWGRGAALAMSRTHAHVPPCAGLADPAAAQAFRVGFSLEYLSIDVWESVEPAAWSASQPQQVINGVCTAHSAQEDSRLFLIEASLDSISSPIALVKSKRTAHQRFSPWVDHGGEPRPQP
jgi:hypothetical protein